jgi:hypothetical protein
MLLPSLLDHYLAKAAFAAQETPVPVSPARKDNLLAPVADLHRTRGSFGREASTRAIVVPGPLARVAPVIAGAALFFGFGLLAGRARFNSQFGARRLEFH